MRADPNIDTAWATSAIIAGEAVGDLVADPVHPLRSRSAKWGIPAPSNRAVPRRRSRERAVSGAGMVQAIGREVFVESLQNPYRCHTELENAEESHSEVGKWRETRACMDTDLHRSGRPTAAVRIR